MLAGAAPHAFGEPGGLCGRSLHAADAEYEIVDVSHDITDGNFLGLCANQEYGVFDVFVDSGSAEELVLTIPKEEFDPRQFDYQRCGFGYSANGSGSKHAGIRAEQISQTDEQRVIRFSWDIPVSQISYLKSPVTCMEKHDTKDRPVGLPYILKQGWWHYANGKRVSLDASCASAGAHIIHLNHTISGGKLDRICSMGKTRMLFDISPHTYGELIVDIPNDVFPMHYSGYGGGGLVGPDGEPLDDVHDDFPFAMTTWNRYGIPYNTMVFDHTEGVSRISGEIVSQDYGFPIPFFWGRPVTKISEHPAFDRYSIPFGADDVRIVFWIHVAIQHALYYDYHPEKYEVKRQGHFCRDQ